MLLKETQLMSKKHYPKIRQIVVECQQETMVDKGVAVAAAVVVVCVDHHLEWAVDGDLWVVNQTLVAEAVVIDLVVVAVVVVVMELEEIMVIVLHHMEVVMVVIWEAIVGVE